MRKIKIIIVAAMMLLGAWLLGHIGGRRHFREATKKITDTLVVIDTHIIEKPVLVERTSKEAVLVAVHDTTWIHDTLYVALPMETKTYKGEDYLAEVSGYNPSLDRIEVYPKKMVVSKTEIATQHVTKRHKLSVGLEANYSVFPFVPVYIEYTNMVHKNMGIYGRAFYDFPSQAYGVGLGVKVCVGW